MKKAYYKPETEKTNIVTIKIDYPTCYQIKIGLDYIFNNPTIKHIPYSHDLQRLNYDLHRIVTAVLQGSTITDIKSGTLFEHEAQDSELPF